MADRVAVILSEGQSNHPAKRCLEEAVVAGLAGDARLDVMVVPHLYDLRPDSPALIMLQAVPGDLVVLSWLYPRAAHWTLDRHNIRGRLGETARTSGRNERAEPREEGTEAQRPDRHTPRVIDQRPVPTRSIYHLDLRIAEDPRALVDEVQRIASELAPRVADSSGGLDSPPRGTASRGVASAPALTGDSRAPARRWYPVIDYSRCTNCMECIDFCLFGVYGIDHQETILVEQPDNCRKGCPACSRVCPENAIIFPQHKTPLIAGDPGAGGDRKIDLSQLFGKPTDLEIAARERDEHLRLAQRDGTGPPDGDPADSASRAPAPHDELDDLIDELDQLDL